MTDEFDPFAPGSNIKENFDGVTRCVFEKSENSDNYNAHMYIMATDGEEVETFLSLGKDWVSYDGGKSVEHPRGDQVKFNGQTNYSEFIVFAMGGFDGDASNPDEKAVDPEKGLGAAKIMRERNRELGNRGPQHAAIWDDLMFHFDVLKRKGRSPVVTKQSDGSEKREWVDTVQDRMMPVRFVGMQGRLDVDAGTRTTVASGTAPVGTTPDGTAVQGSGQPDSETTSGVSGVQAGAIQAGVDSPAVGIHPALADLHPADRAAVISLARSVDFGGFVDGVMQLPTQGGGSMLQQPKVIQALSDEGFYTSLRQ